ncbi:hypothetical protein Emed_006368 [Eimeria media]
MEDINASQQGPPEEDVANNLQEGSSDSSEDEEAASSVDDSPESYIEPGVVKAMRRLAKHRASLTPLALLASALVLAFVVRTQMHLVEAELVEAAEKPQGEPLGPPGVSGVPEKTPKKPMVGAFGTRKGAEKPHVEPLGPPGVSEVPEKTPKKPMVGAFDPDSIRWVDLRWFPMMICFSELPSAALRVRRRWRSASQQLVLPLFGVSKVQKLVNDVVQWAKDAPVEKDRCLDRDDLWNSRLTVSWRLGGVKYDLLGHFKRLTPAYDAEKIAAELENGVLKLLVKTHLYEEDAREGKDVPFCIIEFGDPESGKGTVSIRSEFFRSLRLAISPLSLVIL